MQGERLAWVDGLTIGQMLREVAGRHPSREAYVFSQFDKRATFAELDRQVDGIARSLLALGLARGDNIAVWATNWPQWLLLQLGSARAGVVLVTVNPAYRSHELSYVLKQSDTRVLFLIDKYKSSHYFGMLNEALPELAAGGELKSAEFPRLAQVVAMTDSAPPGVRTWPEFLALGDTVSDAELGHRERLLSPADAINIQYTSGTTGFPKGATLTHRNLLLNAYFVGANQKLTEHDRVCVPVPFYHCFGCVLGVLCCAVHAATIVIPYEYFCPTETLETLEREQATSLYGVPTMFIAVLNDATRPQRTLGALRTGIMAGSPCPIEVMQQVTSDLGASEVTIAYGLTEASPVITQTRTDDPLELRVTTVGKALPALEVRLVEPGTDRDVADGEQGELCVRGHVVMLGYYGMPEQTQDAIDSEGWLHSGDLATRLPNGYYKITGRLKDMVIRGGENIYPREIEEFLYTHPAIQDVAVVGVPDPKYIEELAAWVRLKPGSALTEDELRTYCRGKLAHYKIPRYVRFVAEFPQTVTGKIQKYKIRETMIDELGLADAADRKMA